MLLRQRRTQQLSLQLRARMKPGGMRPPCKTVIASDATSDQPHDISCRAAACLRALPHHFMGFLVRYPMN
jgi:hypothetical protein